MNEPTQSLDRRRARWLWSLTRGQRKRYALALVSLTVGSVLLAMPPIVIGVTIDFVVAARADGLSPLVVGLVGLLGGREFLAENLWFAGAVFVALSAAGGAAMYLKSRLTAQACENIARDLRDRLYNHLQHLPASWHDTAQTGDTVQRCSSDVETVRNFYSNQITEIVRTMFVVLTIIPLLFLIDWVMALVAVALLPVIVAFAVVFFTRVQGTFKAMDEAEGAMTTVIQENLTGIRVVRAFARQDFENEKFDQRNQEYRRRHWDLFKVMAVYWSGSDFLCFAQIVLVVVVSAARVAAGEMSVGTMVMFMTFSGMYIFPVRMMGRTLTETGKAMVAMGRIREVLDAPEESDPPDPLTLPARVEGRICFEGVSFRRRDVAILDDVSFEVHPGQTLALIGPSGSGKSTIANLLMRLYSPDRGVIRIDGVDIARCERKAVRSVVSAVMQEPFLYGKTVRENLRVGRPDATDPQIIEAAQVAHIHDSVLSFSGGYDTLVGERGVTLSGGQRQRVAIARALLRDAPILILDDALSAVDIRTESQIIAALEDRKDRRTTLLIAHRLSTLRHADQILVLDHGRIVQRGTHQTLLETPGIYRDLWQIQTALEEDLQQEMEPTGVS